MFEEKAVKAKILTFVEELGREYKAMNNSSPGDYKPGVNQFKTLALACNQAECVEEVYLSIRYRMAKAHQSEGWSRKTQDGGKAFGEFLVSRVETLLETVNLDPTKNRQDALAVLALFFGFLHWEVTVVSQGL